MVKVHGENMSQEGRKIRCPYCDSVMSFQDWDYNDEIRLNFKCPKCGLVLRLFFGDKWIIKNLLEKMGYKIEDERLEELGEGKVKA